MALSKIEIRKQFGKSSNWQGFLAVAQDFIFLSMSFYLAYHYGHHPLVALLLIGFIGMIQFAIFESLVHEASHGNLFASKKLNNVFGNLFCYLSFTSLDEWANEHRYHHGFLFQEQDHIVQDYKTYQLDKGHHPFYIWFLRPLLGIVGYNWLQSELSGLKNPFVLICNLFLLAIGWGTGTLTFILIFWYLPLIWIHTSVLYWSEITDHYLAKSGTRSNLGFFWNFFYHNGGYHWIHHEYPYIPFYLLPQAHRIFIDKDADSVPSSWQMYQLMLSDYNKKKNN